MNSSCFASEVQVSHKQYSLCAFMLPIGIIVLIFVELVTLTHHHHQICKLCWEMQWSEWSTRSSCPHNTLTDAFSTERFTMKLLLMLVLATIHLDAPPKKSSFPDTAGFFIKNKCSQCIWKFVGWRGWWVTPDFCDAILNCTSGNTCIRSQHLPENGALNYWAGFTLAWAELETGRRQQLRLLRR